MRTSRRGFLKVAGVCLLATRDAWGAEDPAPGKPTIILCMADVDR